MANPQKLAKLADAFVAASSTFMKNGILTDTELRNIEILTTQGKEYCEEGAQFLEEANNQYGMRDDDPELFDMLLNDNKEEGAQASLIIADFFARAAERSGLSDKVADFIPIAKTGKKDVADLTDEGMDSFAKLVQIARTKHNLP